MSKEVAQQLAEADKDAISVDDENPQPVSGDDIRHANLSDDAAKTGLSERELESAARRWEADRLYEEANDNPSLSERVRSKSSNASERLKAFSRIFVRQPDYQRTVTVENVGGKRGHIILTLTLDDEQSEERDVFFEPDSHELDFLLNYTNAETPSELEERTVPVKPRGVGSRVDYKLHIPEEKDGFLPTYRWKRLMIRAGAYSHGTDYGTLTKSSMEVNRNFSLVNALIMGCIGVPPMIGAYIANSLPLVVTLSTIGAFPLAFSALFAVGYLVSVLFGIVSWIATALLGKP